MSASASANLGENEKKRTDAVPPVLIWFEKSSTKKTSPSKLSVHFFANRDECLEEIRRRTSEPIFLVVSSQSATEILSVVHPLEQIDTIFVFCSSAREKQRCEYLRQHYSKIFDFFDNETQLLQTLEQWTNLHQRQSANDYLRLGEDLQKQGEWNRALQYTQRALLVYRKSLPNENHPLVARCLNNLGAIYDAQGDVNRSFEFYEKAVQIYGKLTPQMQSKQRK